MAKWDVIIVGARCGGASTALLAARRGHKVLLVDRAKFPSDTLSTHFLWPRGASYLNRWGVLDRVLDRTPSGTEIHFSRDGIGFSARTPLAEVEKRLEAVHGNARGAVDRHVSVRRVVLDQILLEAARQAGASSRENFNVEELVVENDRVVGVAGRVPDGRRMEERAKLVVGADGRNSQVAKLIGAPITEERNEATFAYWTYLSGFTPSEARMEKRGRLAVVVVPTNFSANMTLVFGPKEYFPLFRRNHEENFYRAISFVRPELGELARAAKREERFYGIADQRAFKRQSAGPGWMLTGDAACIKDQCTAIGMTHAFRDAELADCAIADILSGSGSGSDAERIGLRRYALGREADLDGYYDFVCRSAAMPQASVADLRIMRAIEGNPEWASCFAAMYGDAMKMDTFLTKVRPEIARHAEGAAATESPSTAGAEIFAD